MLLLYLVGMLALGMGVAMLPSLFLALIDDGIDIGAFLYSTGLAIGLGIFCVLLGRGWAKQVTVGHREGFLIVGTGWLFASLLGAIPYWFTALMSPETPCASLQAVIRPMAADFCSFSHAVFESVSGFTTTGATVISDGLWGETMKTPDGRIGLPRGLLLWRAMTQYLGGMGIIVLGVAVLPLLGVGGMQLFKAEVPGPTSEKFAPRVGETAKLLWKVYLVLSAILFVLYSAGGMDSFDALCHTMTTMATGGFSTRVESMGGFQSAYLETVCIVFMVISGINFTLHFVALRGRKSIYFRDLEWWTYISLGLVGTIVVAGALLIASEEPLSWRTLRMACFQVVSIMTTTGYTSVDYEQWTAAPAAILVLICLMVTGGMAGSTSGGFKVVRHILLVRVWIRELFYLVHPHSLRPIRMGGRVISDEVIRAVSAFAGAYIALLALGTVFFCFDGQTVETAFAASVSSLGNVGPAWAEVGPSDHFGVLSPMSLWVSSLLMILGRLEIFTILVLLSPTFWRR